MTGPLLPFKIAADLQPLVASGQVKLFGAVLKDTATGKIVSHVQPTGLLQAAFSKGAHTVATGLDPFSTAGSMTALAQNEQIKGKLDLMQNAMGQMQTLQVANLGLSVLGIGVTIASTALILHRIDKIDTSIQRLEEKLDDLPRQWRNLRLGETFVEMKTHIEQLDEARFWTDPTRKLNNVEDRLDHAFNNFSDGVVQVSLSAQMDAELLANLLSALALASHAQFKALIWLDQKNAAKARAQKHLENIKSLRWRLPSDILSARLSNAEAAPALATQLTEIHLGFTSRPDLVAELVAQDINGHAYIEQMDAEEKEPFLFLPAINTV